MNYSLPKALRIKSAEDAENGFHARFSAKGKQYRYLIKSVREPSPFLDRFMFQVEKPLNLDRMREGAFQFLGTHDFSSFTKSPERFENPVREIKSAELSVHDQVIMFDVTGTGFLHNMVRNMAKALVLIGIGDMSPIEISELYRNQDRRRLGAPAPPGGLYLMKVMY